MAELSYRGDGRILDSIMLPCAASAEAELRSLFRQLSTHGGFASESLNGADLTRLDHSELFTCWLQRLHAQVTEVRDGHLDPFDRWLPFCPDLRHRIKTLVSILAASNSSGSEKLDDFVLGRRNDTLWNVLSMLKKVAVDPCDIIGPNQDFNDQILRARRVLFLRMEEISFSDMEVFPYRSRKRKARIYPSETMPGEIENEMLKQPTRRSQRTPGLLKIFDNHLPRMRIPVGSSFQADVPEWIEGSHENADAGTSRWLGTQVWPPKRRGLKAMKATNIRKVRRKHSCHCSHTGSTECIKIHVSSARLRLKAHLGSVFNRWGFDIMGEDVAKWWTSEEQIIFDNIVRMNPLSEDKSFLDPASTFFVSKSRKDIVNYYFNVYLLRRMRDQTRTLSADIDSEDDDGKDNTYGLGSYTIVPSHNVAYSISSQSSVQVYKLDVLNFPAKKLPQLA